MKRCFDVALGMFGLLVAGPAMVLIAISIKCDSRGPVIYRGQRVGRGGKPFRMCKFRTMVVNAEQVGASSTAADDVRITRVGRLLRRYKLDELPQLFNVIGGQMSFVGPRPEVQKFVDIYTEEERGILQLRPGITDWASIWNSDEGSVLKGCADPDAVYEQVIRPMKIQLQLKYLADHSVRTDLKILAYTAGRLVFKHWTPAELATIPPPKVPVDLESQRPAA